MKLKARVNGQPSTIEIDLKQIVKYATVTGVTGNRVNLKFDGELVASTMLYTTTVACAIGNKVMCLCDDRNFTVIGVTK